MDDISIIHRAAAIGLAVNPDPEALRDATRRVMDGVVARAGDVTASAIADDLAWALAAEPGSGFPSREEAERISDEAMGQDWSSLQTRDMCWRFLRRLSEDIVLWTAADAADAHDLAGFDDVMGMARLFCDTYDATAPSRRRR